jgi:hypothetical protein
MQAALQEQMNDGAQSCGLGFESAAAAAAAAASGVRVIDNKRAL